MAFRVNILPEASEDLEQLYSRVVEAAPLHGADWFNGLEGAIFSLRQNPLRCPMAYDIPLAEGTVRRLLYGKKPNTYCIYYQVIGQTVEILHVRHGARMPLWNE